MLLTGILFLFYAGPLQIASQVPKKMLRVHVAGNELRSIAHNFRQNRFTFPVNRCHFDQVNDASPHVPRMMRFFPSRFQLIRPLPNQMTLQGPPEFIG
jgi:hypothetical protein